MVKAFRSSGFSWLSWLLDQNPWARTPSHTSRWALPRWTSANRQLSKRKKTWKTTPKGKCSGRFSRFASCRKNGLVTDLISGSKCKQSFLRIWDPQPSTQPTNQTLGPFGNCRAAGIAGWSWQYHGPSRGCPSSGPVKNDVYGSKTPINTCCDSQLKPFKID